MIETVIVVILVLVFGGLGVKALIRDASGHKGNCDDTCAAADSDDAGQARPVFHACSGCPINSCSRTANPGRSSRPSPPSD